MPSHPFDKFTRIIIRLYILPGTCAKHITIHTHTHTHSHGISAVVQTLFIYGQWRGRRARLFMFHRKGRGGVLISCAFNFSSRTNQDRKSMKYDCVSLQYYYLLQHCNVRIITAAIRRLISATRFLHQVTMNAFHTRERFVLFQSTGAVVKKLL